MGSVESSYQVPDTIVSMNKIPNKYRLKVIEVKTMNSIVQYNMIKNPNKEKYQLLQIWNSMLEEKPLYANYYYNYEKLRISKIKDYFMNSSTPIKTHINLEGITETCFLVLKQDQQFIFDEFQKSIEEFEKM
jgi:hypothetical protein